MRHRVAGRHLGRDTDHRLSLYRNLVTDLLRYERITTTEAKAKEIRPMAERVITLGKRGDLHARRQALKFVYDPRVVKRVFDEIAPRMADRPGGYCRITKLEPRKGDGARMATIEMIDYVDAPATPRPQRVTAAPAAAPAARPADEVEAIPADAEAEEAEAPQDELTEVPDAETDEPAQADVEETPVEAEAEEVATAEVETAEAREAGAPEAEAADEAVAEAESPAGADEAPEAASGEDDEPKES